MSSTSSGGMSMETWLADDLVGGVAEDSLGPPVPARDDAVEVFETMMSSDDSTMAASRSFSSSARRFSVTSRKTRTTPATCAPVVDDGGGTVVDRASPCRRGR